MSNQNFVFNPPPGAPQPYTAGKAKITIPPGHLLTPHWHPNSNEITTCAAGFGTVTLIFPDPENPGDPGNAIIKTYEFGPGQVVFLPQGYFHYFVNTSEEDFVIDLTFDNKDFDILSLNEITHLMPENIKIAALNGDPSQPVIPYEVQ